jgi:hypothetical protein
MHRRKVLAAVAGSILMTGLPRPAFAIKADMMAAKLSEIGRHVEASRPGRVISARAAKFQQAIEAGATLGDFLLEVRRDSASEFREGRVVRVGSQRLAEAEAALALACWTCGNCGGRA